MKFYDINRRCGVHVIKVSLQTDQYKGSFTYEMGGNCKGRTVLDFDIEINDKEDIERFQKNGCKIERPYNDEWLLVTLTDPETGNTCEHEITDDEFNDMVVGLEIIEFKKDDGQ